MHSKARVSAYRSVAKPLDFVFLIMNEPRRQQPFAISKVKPPAQICPPPPDRRDVSAAADTDAYMRAEILSYSRARGVFAGASLEGSTLRRMEKPIASCTAAMLTPPRSSPNLNGSALRRRMTSSPRFKIRLHNLNVLNSPGGGRKSRRS